MFTFSGGGITVACDPVPPEVGYRYGPVAADVVLISHDHFDHGYLDGIKGGPKVLTAPGEINVNGLRVTGIECFHDSNRGADRGSIIIFTWEQAGFLIGHFGDLGEMPGPEVLEKLKGLDIAMIPVGGVFTIDGQQAARLAFELQPAVVMPMHYGTPECSIHLDPVSEFIHRFSGETRRITDRPLKLARDSLPSSTEAWVVPFQ